MLKPQMGGGCAKNDFGGEAGTRPGAMQEKCSRLARRNRHRPGMAKNKKRPKWRAAKAEVYRSGLRIKIVLATGEVAYGDVQK